MNQRRSRGTAVVLVLLAGACRPASMSSPEKPRAEENRGGIFEENAGLRCSPDPVACSGILPVRRPPSNPGAGQLPQVAVLRSGEEAFRARVASLRAARRSIRVQALIFRADEAGLYIADLLKRRRADGLQVQVIVDALSNLDWNTQWMYFDLKRHGIEVEGYEALYMQWLGADLRPGDPMRPNKRFHDKLWVIDGEDAERGVAIVGGLNVANEYFRLGPEVQKRWRDQDVVVRGPLVDDARQVFDRNYAYCKALKAVVLSKGNPDNVWRLSRPSLARLERVAVPTWSRPEVATRVRAEAAKPWSGTFHAVVARLLQSRPRLRESFITQAYQQLIDGARRRILLANAYFVPSQSLQGALHRAARRGVKVTIITNSPDSNDIRAVALISRHLYLPVLAVNEDATITKQGGAIELREWIGPASGEGTLHAKMGLFDEDTAIVGSFNLDPRSDRLNSETALAMRSREVVQELDVLVRSEYLPRSRSISLSEARALHQPDGAEKRFETLFYIRFKDWL